jgi:hypothetical protein
MGKSQRDKGYRGEHEAQQIAEAAGLSVKRNFMSGMYVEGGADLEINFRPVSVKRRKNGMDMFYKELQKCDYVLFRADNKGWLKIERWKP